jgi:16S rRNA (uracil1498-N3)-methyltransferase
VHVRQVARGRIELDAEQAHHVRDVLRMAVGDEVEAFDDEGSVATAALVEIGPAVVVEIDEVQRRENVMQLTIASAVAKGERADWMVEKLSELGCARFIPLITARSVVLPEGRNKFERWARIATESAKQSRRVGVMKIDPLTRVQDVPSDAQVCVLSTESQATPIADVRADAMTLLVGPEGGWTDEELALFSDRRYAAVTLTQSILRVETAAIAAAAVVMILAASRRAI